eukprot:6451789-Heterocapsa_arctica.AAC.1
MDVLFVWTLIPQDHVAKCVCHALVDLNEDHAGHLAYILAMSVVQYLNQTVQDRTAKCGSGFQAPSPDGRPQFGINQ